MQREKHPSYTPYVLTAPDKLIVTLLWHYGLPIHRIAALFDVNQGRIGEVVRIGPKVSRAEN